jgi:hypothetical protein
MRTMLFHDAARAILISFTTYCPKADMWTSNMAFYEFGVSELVISSFVRSYAFKPNFYESKEEAILFIIDIVRISLTLIIVVSLLIAKVIKIHANL